ncbi:hypothetical protein P872_22500 [Rhodonellum psychrophilum GCM71 = DSM 17998]|uniref:protein-tyrosine-phosphatase n=2 Tax=Rhodonellum TaxID=336827 RepID=U5C4X4_9BACT|nr:MULTISPECIES: low molecular weight protein-tyrosine-phosphatase [Rhodonellum]ERM84834.1 hypothetical protein P872_22500 [Rhodonellum psychrophilum GCM71 = DSM 17998]MDO9552083.1 low molecular weight protein-tyrosine-phosphatase [Rhodonellum sp.]SDY71356.1 protein tyrosine phosphatase [Rhodonellum ikkaensis]
MIKVLFVCLGNICRSPLAEAIFNHKLKAQNLIDKFSSDSCGTSDYHIGELPDERTLKCAKRNNIPIDHRGRQIHRVDIREFQYIIAMDDSNKSNIQEQIKQSGLKHKKVFLMREFQSDPDHIDVPDPYYGNEDGFDLVYNILDDSINSLLEHLKSEHKIFV